MKELSSTSFDTLPTSARIAENILLTGPAKRSSIEVTGE
jgi:hypothetical protein